MTKEHLTDMGVIFDQWINMDSICPRLLFSNETTIWTTRGTNQFYFDTDSNLLFIRSIDKISDVAPLKPSPFVVNYIDVDNVEKYAYLNPGAAVDSEIGPYYLVFDIDSLVGLY